LLAVDAIEKGLLTELRRAIVTNESLCAVFLRSPLAGFVDPQTIAAWPKMHGEVPIRAKACADVLEAVIGCAWLASKDVLFVEQLARNLGVLAKMPSVPLGMWWVSQHASAHWGLL
jgi:dsRNA-specific ribonuclease